MSCICQCGQWLCQCDNERSNISCCARRFWHELIDSDSFIVNVFKKITEQVVDENIDFKLCMHLHYYTWWMQSVAVVSSSYWEVTSRRLWCGINYLVAVLRITAVYRGHCYALLKMISSGVNLSSNITHYGNLISFSAFTKTYACLPLACLL